MKRTFAFFIATLLCASFALAGEVKVKVVLATGPKDEPVTSFAPDTPKVFALFKTKGAKDGDKLRGVWIAEDVGDVAPPKTKVEEKTLTLEGDTDDGDFSLSKPTKGWPVGKYRFEIYINGELATSENFTIKGAEKAEKKSEETAAADDEYTFKVHNTTKDKIKKLLASEDGEEYLSFDVGRAGIAPGKTMTLKWDKSTNNSSCKWFIKAVFDDGSETDAKKFDFCEEDLELEF